MLKYENKGNTIEIKLPKECGHNGYSVECTYYYDKQKNQYQLRIGLKHIFICPCIFWYLYI